MTENTSRRPMRVGIACNIKTNRDSDAQAEFDEPEAVAGLEAALRAGGFETVILEAAEGFPRKLEAERPDIVFNIAEGMYGRGREAQIPAILDYYGIPYTGSDVAALSIALDKALTKRVAESLGLLTPPYAVIKRGGAFPGGLPFPVLIKPNAEGSSKGISDVSVADGPEELRGLLARAAADYGGDLLAEQYIDGREFTVGIIGNGPDARVFEPMEVIFRKLRGPHKVYSYEVKRNFREYISYQSPPELPGDLTTRMKRGALAVYEALGCLDFARFDFRLSVDGAAYFLEANPLPGLDPDYSDFPIMAGLNGMDYGSLVLSVLNAALKRYGRTALP